MISLGENCAIILAAGDGKRMKSTLPKVLNEVLFEPMLEWVILACENSGLGNLCVVAGYEHEVVERYLGGRHDIALQLERKGTAHAVMQAESFLNKHSASCDNVLILCGDAPFMNEDTITNALKSHTECGNDVTVITALIDDPTGYGRIVRNGDKISAIVEQKEASDKELLIKEVNSGAYWFKISALLSILDEFESDNSQNEFYLTDAISIILNRGGNAGAFTAKDAKIILGANDKRALFNLHKIANDEVINKHFDNGVEFLSLDGVIIGRNVKIGANAKIHSGTIIKGDSVIGEGAVIGPNTIIDNCIIGKDSVLNSVQAYDSTIASDVRIGPFVHIRPNSEIRSGVKIGDFVEIKNSTIGENTSMSHLTYVGDSDVGKNVNFGCGCVTVNYDGCKKSRTIIKDRAFIGCNTNLIAPVTIGEGAYTAAGSTITQDVPDHALAIERGKQNNKEGYALRKIKK
ncbi:MAG: bifunctional UDP-N-acetylglucosamine diphosphorylase/glucosamine-1-phosphate N-acetyltransferase GlmU [Clostridiales bacterium]|nr:bifunctional UDP-N-acetylglucosamine diphosphorylase/glucosamine-1-phosphate N-acetyltransferase GlmU [Clostridiales bacterium]